MNVASPLVGLPLSKARRARVITEITDTARPQKAIDVPTLVEMVEKSLRFPFEAGSRTLLVLGDRSESEHYRKFVQRVQKFRKDAAILMQTLEVYGDTPGRTMVTWVNPFSVMVMEHLALSTGREQCAFAAELRRDIVAVAEWPTLKPPPRSGRKRTGGPKQQLVRAVCYYLSSANQPVEYTWKSATAGENRRRGGRNAPLTDAQLPPSTRTAMLVVAVAKAFQLGVPYRELRSELENCRQHFGVGGVRPPWSPDADKAAGGSSPAAES